MGILRKKQKEMLRIKNTATEMKNSFDGLIRKLHMAEGSISELEDLSEEFSNTEKEGKQTKQKTKNKRNEQNIRRQWDNYKGITYV